MIFGSIFICLSEKDFEIITLSKSSVGRSMPMNKKLSVLDFKSFNWNEFFFIEWTLLITIKFSICLDWLNIEYNNFSSTLLLKLSIIRQSRTLSSWIVLSLKFFSSTIFVLFIFFSKIFDKWVFPEPEAP